MRPYTSYLSAKGKMQLHRSQKTLMRETDAGRKHNFAEITVPRVSSTVRTPDKPGTDHSSRPGGNDSKAQISERES